MPKIPSNIAVREQDDVEEKIADANEVVFADRLVEEQVRRSCKVCFEDESKHGIKHVSTAGGQGEEFRTQDGRIGDGVGGDMHGGGRTHRRRLGKS